MAALPRPYTCPPAPSSATDTKTAEPLISYVLFNEINNKKPQKNGDVLIGEIIKRFILINRFVNFDPQ